MPTVKQQTRRKEPVLEGGGVVSRIAPVHLEEHGIKMSVYGRSGTGKTTFMSTWPKPLLHIICSSAGLGEMRSIYNVKGIDAVEIRRPVEFDELVAHAKDTGKYKTVCLDHVTGFSDMVLGAILGLEKLPEQSAWGLAQQQDYAKLGLQLKEYMRGLLDLDCNVIINGQEREFNTDNESDLIMPNVGTALTPSVAGWLNTACDYICQTYIKQRTEEKERKVAGKSITTRQRVDGVEYCLRVGPHSVFTTKFRLPKGHSLPEYITDPTYKEVNKLIKGE